MGPRLAILALVALLGCASADPPIPEANPAAGPTAQQVADETLMYAMVGTRIPTGQAASLVAMRLDGRDQWVAPLIEMVRLAPAADDFGATLEAITGKDFGMDWPRWVEWYGTTDLTPPYGFARWKGALFAEYTGHADFTRFVHADMNPTIRVEEIVWGGVGPDGIPPLENPAFVGADTDAYGDDEFVVGVSIGDDHRAYPLRIINWHEMVNDVVGDTPVSLAYCTLCGSAVLYEGAVTVDGARTKTTFGTSGLLMRSNKLMYDRKTGSLWNQITGLPVSGPLAGTNTALTRVPVVTETWGAWKARHPTTRVLSPDTGHERNYAPGEPYGDYFASEDLMFPVWTQSKALPKKEVVFALIVDGTAKAYPLSRLTEGTLEDRVGTVDVRLEVGPEAPATDEPAGRAVRAYRADTGERLAGHNAFWFGWFAYYPQTEIYE